MVSEGDAMKQQNLFGDSEHQAHSERENDLRRKPQATRQYVSSIWSFPDRGSGNHLYRWYGTLPRPMVERLLSLYASDGSAQLFDPFVGSGTTMEVAADASLRATGLDSNPLACLTTEARLSGIPSEEAVLVAADQVVDDLTLGASNNSAVDDESWLALAKTDRYGYTRKWFRTDTLSAVTQLFLRVAEVDDKRVQRLLFVVAAQVIRHVASVDPRCTHHLVTKQKPFIDPLPVWRKGVAEAVATVRREPADSSKIRVAQASALEPPMRENSADFAIVHPPYLGVINYHLIHRLASDILDAVNIHKAPAALEGYDFDYQDLKRNDVSTDSTDRYQQFVRRLAVAMQNVVAPDGRCVVIIGDQRHKGHIRHPFTDFIHWFEENGFALEENFIWVLQNNGGMHILRRGHFIDHNYILVFHKEPAK